MKDILHNVLKAAWLTGFIALMISSPASAQSGLSRYFSVPEHHGRMILVVYKEMVPDTSPEWGKVLLAGLLYAAAVSPDEEMLAVGIKELDMVTRVYSVRRADLDAFMNERISLLEFSRKMYMARVPSQ